MICTHCGKEITNEYEAKLISCDGDFIHKSCEAGYDREKEHFCSSILTDDAAFDHWLFGGLDKEVVKNLKEC